MRYQFPHINHINDVLPAIQDSPEFIVADRGAYKIINYVVAHPETFPEVKTVGLTNGEHTIEGIYETEKDHYAAIRRECRGLIFCSETGKILRRPFHKFFNISERDETQLNLLNFSIPHSVLTKEDGSMIVPFEVGYGSGIIRFGTKMGITEVSMGAEVFVAQNPKYMEFSKWCINNELSPIFEWCSRKQRIVLDYPEDRLILLAVRHMITGEYLSL